MRLSSYLIGDKLLIELTDNYSTIKRIIPGANKKKYPFLLLFKLIVVLKIKTFVWKIRNGK